MAKVNQPPFCPGTEARFEVKHNAVWLIINAEKCINSISPVGRQIISRYQSCAWQDREKELWNMSYTLTYVAEGFMNRGIESMPHSPDAHCAALQASINAAAWREWERDA